MTISSIGSDVARDYATIAAWEADSPASLVSVADTWEGELHNDSEFSTSATTSIAGITADVDNNVQLRCATGESFVDSAVSAALDYNQTNGAAQTTSDGIGLEIGVDFTTVNGVQFEHTAAAYDRTCLHIDAQNVDISQVICRGGGGASANRACVRFDGFNSDKGGLTNALIVVDISEGLGLVVGYASSNVDVITACTIVKPDDITTGGVGVTARYGNQEVKGCAVFGFTTAFSGSYNASSDYNASDDATSPGANSLDSQTYSSQFENVNNATADYRLASGSSLEAAAIQFTETGDVDIKGQARDVSTPDIGCWEFQAAGGGGAAVLLGPIIQNYRNMGL